MKSLSSKARLFILLVILVGSGALVSQLSHIATTPSWLTLLVCCLVVIPLQILKIEGITSRTSYNLGWIVYGFSFLVLGAPAAVLVVLVAHLMEWFWYRYPWYIQAFNVATFSIGFDLIVRVYQFLYPYWTPPQQDGVQYIITSFAILTFVNHLLVGGAIHWARNQSFAESGVLDPELWLMDLGLLALGAIAAIVWESDRLNLLLVVSVIYLLYRALMVPSLRRQVEVDPKTGIYNMGFFNAKLEEEFTRAQRMAHSLSVIMADLDHLRDINNTYGHITGDLVIQGVASALVELRPKNGVVARFGGEEFVVLLPETEAADAAQLAEAMRSAVEKAVFNSADDAHPIRVTMSFGVAEHKLGKAVSTQELLQQADQALYDAKQQGRNQVCVSTGSIIAPRLATRSAVRAEATARTQAPPVSVSRAAQAAVALPTVEPPVPLAAAPDPVTPPASQAPPQTQNWLLRAYVGAITAAVFVVSVLLLPLQGPIDWAGILLFVVLAMGAELSNLQIYVRQTSVSTSAVPLIAGVLLFGPVAALCIGPTIAAMAWIRYRSPFIRFWLNCTNHVLGGMICAGLVLLSGKPWAAWPVPEQVGLTVCCGLALYLSTTSIISGAIGISDRVAWTSIWKERFRWLGLHFLALSVVSYGLITSYMAIGLAGVVIVLIPLLLLRYSQKQYLDHTEAMVTRLQKANAELTQRTQEVEELNAEMLDLLAATLDLRHPSVQSHSAQVALYATQIAEAVGLPAGQVEQIRRAGLLHDIGKLSIPESILYKPSQLTPEEYAAVQQHPAIGATLLSRFRSFRHLTEYVLHHHEHYDGTGYPKGLAGKQIPLEARILGLADAVEAMASERPYRPAASLDEIKRELKRCAGTQFDPHLVDVFLYILDSRRDTQLVDSAQERSRQVPHWSEVSP